MRSIRKSTRSHTRRGLIALAAVAAAVAVMAAVPTAQADPASGDTSRKTATEQRLSGRAGGTLPEAFGPLWAGDPVEFEIEAQGPPGQTTGRFDVLHEHPDGALVAEFEGDITCLAVGGEVAVATGVITDGVVQLPDGPQQDVTGMKVSFTVHDNGRKKDMFFWQWEFLGAPINECQGTAPMFDPSWGGFDVDGGTM